MVTKEKAHLYPIKEDGTKTSSCIKVKCKKFVFGWSKHCDVRIYIDGIFLEHCVLSVGQHGKVFLEPLHPLAVTFVNNIMIPHKVCLEDNDIITVSTKKFQFTYPINSLDNKATAQKSSIVSYVEQTIVLPLLPSALTFLNHVTLPHKDYLKDIEDIYNPLKTFLFTCPDTSLFSKVTNPTLPVVTCAKQVQSLPNLKMISPQLKNTVNIKNLSLLKTFKVSSVFGSSKNLVNRNDALKLFTDYLPKFTSCELINSFAPRIVTKKYKSDHSYEELIKYVNQCIEGSFKSRRNFAHKFYELFGSLREIITADEDFKYVTLHIFQSLMKYCIDKASGNIYPENNCVMPQTFVYPKQHLWVKKTFRQKSMHTKTLPLVLAQSVRSETEPEEINRNVTAHDQHLPSEYECLSGVDEKDNQHQYSKKKVATGRRRASFVTRRYSFRKRKSVFKAKCKKSINTEDLKLFDEKQEITAELEADSSELQEATLNLDQQKPADEKQSYGRRKKKASKKDKQQEVATQCLSVYSENYCAESKSKELKPMKEKRSYNKRKKNASEKKIDFCKELTCTNVSQNQEIKAELMNSEELAVGLQPNEAKSTKEKKSYKKKKNISSRSTDLCVESACEDIYEKSSLSSQTPQKRLKALTDSESTDRYKHKPGARKLELSSHQRVTRSMARNQAALRR